MFNSMNYDYNAAPKDGMPKRLSMGPQIAPMAGAINSKFQGPKINFGNSHYG